jgi:hypothetical protein
MESTTITVVEVTSPTAVVRGVSRRRVDGEPEAVITLKLRTHVPATGLAARETALKYVDPA